MFNFQLPSALDAERKFIASCIASREVFQQSLGLLEPKHFYGSVNAQIWDVMTQGNTNDAVAIASRLKGCDDGAMAMVEMLDCDIGYKLDEIAGIIRDRYSRREAITAIVQAGESLANDYDSTSADVVNGLQSKLYDAVKIDSKNQPQRINELLSVVFGQIEQWQQGKVSGLTTGLSDLDAILGGFQKSDLIIVAGRPSMGKSTLAFNLVRAAAGSGALCAVFSLEMSKDICAQRFLFTEANVSLYLAKNNALPKRDWPQLSFAAGTLAEVGIIIDDTPAISPVQIMGKCNMLQSKHGPIGLIVVDHIQLARSSRKATSRNDELTQISGELKGIAKTFDCPVVALSQLSRLVEHRNPPRPQLSDLRESGAIEQDADVVMLLYRPEYYKQTDDNKGIAEIIIAKQRNGPTGTIEVMFDADKMTFRNLVKTAKEREGSWTDDI